MKQSVEKQIKQAFDVWDEQKSEFGFDKAALWAAMNEKKAKPVIYLSWYKVASVALILFLSTALLFSFQSKQALKQSNEQLALELDKTKQVVTPKLKQRIIEKIVYKTQIKEIESPFLLKAFAELMTQYKSLQKANTQLKQEALQSETKYASLSENLKILEGNWARIEKCYALELEQLKASNPKSGFSIDINEEALLALSSQKPKRKYSKQRSNKRLIFNINNSMSEYETSAPLFRDLGIK